MHIDGKQTRFKLENLKYREYDESLYTTNKNMSDKYISVAKKFGITNDNYTMETIICPKNMAQDQQVNFLDSILKNIEFNYIASYEYCLEKANGYHVHIIFDIKFITFLEDYLDEASDSKEGDFLEKCIGYISKEKKDYFKSEKIYRWHYINQNQSITSTSIGDKVSRITKEIPTIKIEEKKQVLIEDEVIKNDEVCHLIKKPITRPLFRNVFSFFKSNFSKLTLKIGKLFSDVKNLIRINCYGYIRKISPLNKGPD